MAHLRSPRLKDKNKERYLLLSIYIADLAPTGVIRMVGLKPHPRKRTRPRRQSLMSLPVVIWILSDGRGQHVWTLALDDTHKQLNASASLALLQMCGNIGKLDDHVVVSSGSFGTRAAFYPAGLIAAIRWVDAANVERHHFDLVHVKSHPHQPALGIGRNLALRRLAYKVALTCRLMFEPHSATHEAGAVSVQFPPSHTFHGVRFLLQTFPTTPMGSTASCLQASPLPPEPLPEPLPTGVWAEPLENETEIDTDTDHVAVDNPPGATPPAKRRRQMARFNAF